MNGPAATPDIFDRKRRRALRERAGRRAGGGSFLWQHLASDISERLQYVSRDFIDILIIGPLASHADQILAGRKANVTLAALSQTETIVPDIQVIDEDRLPFAPESHDLIISAGTLDSVNDLPGALVQMRRCLRPDGLFLGSLFGAGTLPQLKAAMLKADADMPSPHIHPQIDLRSAADLLTRAGFALPVADQDILPVRYSSLNRLIEDLRDMGVGNSLAGKRQYLGKDGYNRLMHSWDSAADTDSKLEEIFMLIHLSGWAPSPDQPKPAKPGSGSVSLSDVLKSKN